MGKLMGADSKAKILVLKERGLGISSISKRIKKAKSTVYNFLKRYEKTGSIKNNYISKKPKAINRRQESHLVRLALTNRRATANQLREWSNIEASPQTVRNKLRENHIRARRPIKKPALSIVQNQKRLN